MRKVYLVITVVLFFCLAAIPSFAQNQPQKEGITVGLLFDQNAESRLAAFGTYDRNLVSERLYSYSGYDVVPFFEDGKLKLKFTPFTGLAFKAVTINRLSLFMFGAGGLATTGEVTTGAGKGGGFGHFALGKGWGVIGSVEASYSPISGTDPLVRFGVRYGL
jgi:hypothetical protein